MRGLGIEFESSDQDQAAGLLKSLKDDIDESGLVDQLIKNENFDLQRQKDKLRQKHYAENEKAIKEHERGNEEEREREDNEQMELARNLQEMK